MRSHTTLIPFITLALAIAASAAPAVDQFYDRRSADNTFVSRSSLDLLERRDDPNLHLLSRTEDSGSGTQLSAGELEARGKNNGRKGKGKNRGGNGQNPNGNNKGKKRKKKNRKPQPKASNPAPPVAEASTSTHTLPVAEPVDHASSHTPSVAGHPDASTSTHTNTPSDADRASTHNADPEAGLSEEEKKEKEAAEAAARKKKTRNRVIKGAFALAGLGTFVAGTVAGVLATKRRERRYHCGQQCIQ